MMRYNDEFGILVLTHGRPERVKLTMNSLKRTNYTGRWWMLLDDEDESIDDYRKAWGSEHVLTFHKDDGDADMGDNGGSKGVIIYARNEAARQAKLLGLTYYMQLDDDYTQFAHRWVNDGEKELRLKEPANLDDVLDLFIDFLDVSGARTVAMAQGGDFIGGANGSFFWQGLSRKAMNTFICRTDAPLKFVGRINEDVNTYVSAGARGELLLTFTRFMIVQPATQSGKGGMTEAYVDGGTYVKSFYSVMYAPSAVKIALMGEKVRRVHHRVNWGHAVPKILSGAWKK